MEFPSFFSGPLHLETFVDSTDDIDLIEEEEEEELQNKEDDLEQVKRKLPPPSPLLARTGQLSSRMPWVLNRTYETGGRLVICKVPVKRHEYFRTERKNGRLVLQCMELDTDRASLIMRADSQYNQLEDVVLSASMECKEES